jgi:crotonobetainyl-CoA:carnitine CoA-transferase CaiB-like acyl-CoA transferase
VNRRAANGSPANGPAANGAATPVLSGLRVVELAGDPGGEMLGKLLAELGADVVKVEPHAGSPTRRIGPFVDGHADGDHSLTFWYYNTSKRSVVLDDTTAAGRAALFEMLTGADVCITTLAPADARARALTVDELAAASDRLIVVSLTPFGLTGPWSEWTSSDLVGLALGSPLNSCGYDDHTIPPIRPGGDQGYQSVTSFALMAVMLALVDRQGSGRGQVIDVGMHDCLAVSAELANPYWFYPKVVVHRQTCRHAQPTPTAPALFECADGRYVYFVLFVADDKPFRTLVEWMSTLGVEADLNEPEFADAAHRQANFGHIQGLVEVFFLLQPAAEAYHAGQARGLPIGIAYAPDDLFGDEHLRGRDFFVTVEHDDVAAAEYPGTPIRFSAYPPAPMVRAPRLGEHTADVLASLTTTGDRS